MKTLGFLLLFNVLSLSSAAQVGRAPAVDPVVIYEDLNEINQEYDAAIENESIRIIEIFLLAIFLFAPAILSYAVLRKKKAKSFSKKLEKAFEIIEGENNTKVSDNNLNNNKKDAS